MSNSSTCHSLSLDNSLSIEHQAFALISFEGTRFDLTRKQALVSKLIEAALSNDVNTQEIQVLSKYKDVEISKIVEFLKHHDGEEPAIPEKPLRSKKMREVTTEWCADFVDQISKNRDLLYKVIDLANYFDIPSLLHICCAKVASLIKGEKLENIKKILTSNEDIEETASY
jgi:S-phase kinase-associated protein 1